MYRDLLQSPSGPSRWGLPLLPELLQQCLEAGMVAEGIPKVLSCLGSCWTEFGGWVESLERARACFLTARESLELRVVLE